MQVIWAHSWQTAANDSIISPLQIWQVLEQSSHSSTSKRTPLHPLFLVRACFNRIFDSGFFFPLVRWRLHIFHQVHQCLVIFSYPVPSQLLVPVLPRRTKKIKMAFSFYWHLKNLNNLAKTSKRSVLDSINILILTETHTWSRSSQLP